MNYKIIEGQKFVRIYLDNCIEQLIPVNDTIKIIVFKDKNKSIMNKVDMAYLNLFEKVKFNYDLNDLLINCSEEEIGWLVYKEIINNSSSKYEIKDRIYGIYDKISILLPEDIILI